MKLTTATIRRFRSIDQVDLSDCGQLNVLIGKNNSGKSNILSAIQLFFDFLKSSNPIANVKPPISGNTDWFGRDISQPVVISMVLELSQNEMATVRDAIAREAPQMRNALDEVVAISTIECELTFQRPPSIGFVSRLAFGSESGDSGQRIFGLELRAAYEIGKRGQEARELASQARSIERYAFRLDPNDWETIRDRTRSSSGLARLRVAGDMTEDVNSLFIQFARTSESYVEFRERLSTYIAELQSRAASLRAAESETKFSTFSGESSTVPKYVTKILDLISALKVHHLSEQRKSIGQDEANRILRLKTSRGQGHVLQDIQATVSELLGVQIDAFSSDQQPERGSSMAAELDVDDFLVQVNGSGIREALRLILDFEFERPDILMVEEPEVHLHPALEIAMMQYLRKISSACRIFLTTHSTNFLDIADLNNVYLITKDRSTHIQLLNVEEAEEAIPQELGLRLSSLFMYDRLVFVEGPSDEQILRTFASTLGLNLSRTGIGFVTTGGARNFTHYANAATLSFLSKRRVKLYFVLDRDERDQPEIAKLRDQIANLGDLKVLKRRELENYLAVPDALARYVGTRLDRPVDAEEVKAILNEAADSLLDVAVERLVLKFACRPIFPDRDAVIDRGGVSFVDCLQDQLGRVGESVASLSAEIPNLLEEAKKTVAGYAAEEKLNAIPGDSLLSAVFEKYGLKFSKRKDGPKIASCMSDSEIPAEIASMLRELTS